MISFFYVKFVTIDNSGFSLRKVLKGYKHCDLSGPGLDRQPLDQTSSGIKEEQSHEHILTDF